MNETSQEEKRLEEALATANRIIAEGAAIFRGKPTKPPLRNINNGHYKGNIDCTKP